MDAVQELPDKELLSRHAQGDEHAFGELVRRHRERMWAVAIRVLGDPEEASDALQDAFLSAFRGAHRFRGEAQVSTWLHRIVINACHDRMRRKMVRPAIPTDDVNLDVLSNERYKGTTPDPTSRTDAALDVHAALERLPTEQRLALVLVDMLGYRVDEAAAILEIAAGTVKSRCARGRARLLPYLAHLRNPEPPQDVTSPRGGGRKS
ncbi:RNA polymerase sigma factor SigM [Marinitenerispora sediminis]|uniref:RNA polymerase sigma factor SigM n=1 Tax=Marinitenerispora sediminis TaxID=1931232 RepID=A0A368T225_9ACTN|nr:RNA polymerase sigma factor SigM [Marinitenerispora sediminis]RCV55141.1 RNA polymerase sigma factor SigM [Marinitenerispora sediminis]RCV55466.1 RNA polymerase sigma factor SigM [Marinitenerispora sediminis]RCV61762.1 RNA polymerase sigma factor SigM [Marinitenerispora sediminis]